MSLDTVTTPRLKKAYDLKANYGTTEVARRMGVSRETVRRYCRKYRDLIGEEAGGELDDQILRQVREKFTDAELRNLVAGSLIETEHKPHIHKFKGDTIKFCSITDTHLGSKYTDPEYLRVIFDECARSGVDFITHSGDVVEGLSHRAGHVYECSHIGYDEQRRHAEEVFGQWTDTPIYMIDGNHDRWFIKAAGAKIVSDLADNQANLEFLGHDEGDIKLRQKGRRSPVTIRLWHGEDSSSYATSYRIQKLVESFTGGEKPDAMICGHVHKQAFFMERHIHCLSAGCVQRQSKWMRSKRLAAHSGFWITEMTINDKGVGTFRPTWYPFYS